MTASSLNTSAGSLYPLRERALLRCCDGARAGSAELGPGRLGITYEAKDIRTRSRFAVKILPLHGMDDRKQMEILNQVKSHLRLRIRFHSP